MYDYGKAYRLDGKVAIVTGAARGLGAEIAHALADGGAAVLVTDVLEAEGIATVRSLEKLGARAAFQMLDVTVESQWAAAVEAAIGLFGSLDVMVNNAGIERVMTIAEMPVEDFRRVFDINVTGVFLGCQHAIRAMRPGGASGRGGAIVNMCSVAGLAGGTAMGAYSASKGAVRLLTKSVGIECGQLGYGIRCNSVHPGLVKTDMGASFMQGYVDIGLATDLQAVQARLDAAHPIGHLGKPTDIAAAVRYLCCDVSRFMTGSEFVVDGGYSAI